MGMEKAPVELVVTEEAVTASHYGSAFTVDREDIASLEVLEELPEIRRVAGTGLPSAQTGTFRSEDWGTFTCCVDPTPGALAPHRDGGRAAVPVQRHRPCRHGDGPGGDRVYILFLKEKDQKNF